MEKLPSWGCCPNLNQSSNFGVFQNFYSFRKFRTFQWSTVRMALSSAGTRDVSGSEQGRHLRHHKSITHVLPGDTTLQGQSCCSQQGQGCGARRWTKPNSHVPASQEMAGCLSRSRKGINKTLKRHYSGWAKWNTQVSKQQIKVLQFPFPYYKN